MEKWKTLGYYNGVFGPLEEMTVPMNDRACYFGDGVYEAAYVGNYRIFTLDDHVDRIYRSASMAEIEIPCTKDEMKAVLTEMAQKLESPEQVIYWQVTRGTAMRAHVYPDRSVKANLWITCTPKAIVNAYRKIRVITAEDTRFFHCNIKTLNLMVNCMLSEQAKKAGCEEAIQHRGDRVTEGTHSNVSILKDGVFRTAPADNLILPGITRAHLIEICRRLSVPVREEPYTVQELMDADEIIISSSTGFARSVCEADGRPVGGKAPKLLKALQDALREEFIADTGIDPGLVPSGDS